jgi:hypothetical protein
MVHGEDLVDLRDQIIVYKRRAEMQTVRAESQVNDKQVARVHHATTREGTA